MLVPEKRFIQRVDSYSRAFKRLEEVVMLYNNSGQGRLSEDVETGLQADILQESLIKRFEFTQELSWNVLKDLLTLEGEIDVVASRDTYRRALKYGIIDSPLWLGMIADRNLSAHDYNDTKAAMISQRIVESYYPLFKSLYEDMRKRVELLMNKEGYEAT